MSKGSKLQLSHVLYHVQDLHEAVEKLRNVGFIVEYGTKPEKAYNAIIWFEKGVFIEIFQHPGLSFLAKWFMKIAGYQSVLDRMNKWVKIEQGWCEWSLESTLLSLNKERVFYKTENIPFKFHKAKRKDINGQILRWELLMPYAIDFPFIMSAYSPNPRPKQLQHPNGVAGVSRLIVGTNNLDTTILQQLLPNQLNLELVANQTGLQSVELINSTIRIEDILQ